VLLSGVNAKMPSNFKTLTIRDKQRVREVVKSGRKKKDNAEEFRIPASTLSTILKNSKKIDLNLSTINWTIDWKRKRSPAAFSDVEKCVVKWFNQCRDVNVSYRGSYSERKSRTFSKIIRPRTIQSQ